MAKSPTKKSTVVYEQSTLFGGSPSSDPKPLPSTSLAKKPFVSPQIQALDAKELRNTFMMLLRMVINGANRQPNDPASQKRFAEALLAELRIKKGVGPIDVETRTAILAERR